MIASKQLIFLLAAALLGCSSSSDDELRQWMSDLRATTKPHVVPLTEPKKFIPQAYPDDAGMEPFNQLKLTQALRKEATQLASNAALIAPEMARRKEPLEAYPLDIMEMVGSLEKANGPTALLKIDNLIYPVRVGNYVGPNYGKIMKISESAIHLREIVQDATGDWVERAAMLELQEDKK